MPFSAIRGVRLVGLLLSMFGPSLLAQAATPAGRNGPSGGGCRRDPFLDARQIDARTSAALKVAWTHAAAIADGRG